MDRLKKRFFMALATTPVLQWYGWFSLIVLAVGGAFSLSAVGLDRLGYVSPGDARVLVLAAWKFAKMLGGYALVLAGFLVIAKWYVLAKIRDAAKRHGN